MLKVSDFFSDLKLHNDSHVADFGCGVGENSKILSELLPNGKIFAIDVHKDLLEHLETDIKKQNLKNIVPVWGNIEEVEGTRLRDESVDAILISNTFFLLVHQKTCVLEMKRVLKRHGKILFIDWHKPLGQSVMHKEIVLNEKKIEEIFIESGMSVLPILFKDENHFVLLIQK